MILIADNLQITNPAISAAVDDMLADPILKLVRQYSAAGADMIDINAGPLTKHAEKKMAFLVETVQAACSLPIVLDTANPHAIEAGLQAGKNKIIINGFSLESHKLKYILPLAARYHSDIIGYLLNPDGHVPPDASGRLTVAIELLGKFQNSGLEKRQLIIDPIVAPLLWQDGQHQAKAVLETIRSLPDVLGFKVRTVAGLSNLTSGAGGQPNRRFLEQAYMAMLGGNGLDMALLNIFNAQSVKVARAITALTGGKPFAYDEL